MIVSGNESGNEKDLETLKDWKYACRRKYGSCDANGVFLIEDADYYVITNVGDYQIIMHIDGMIEVYHLNELLNVCMCGESFDEMFAG